METTDLSKWQEEKSFFLVIFCTRFIKKILPNWHWWMVSYLLHPSNSFSMVFDVVQGIQCLCPLPHVPMSQTMWLD